MIRRFFLNIFSRVINLIFTVFCPGPYFLIYLTALGPSTALILVKRISASIVMRLVPEMGLW